MTNKQRNDIVCIKYFIPEVCKNVEITDEDIKMFLEYSDKGLHKDKVGEWQHGEQYRNGFNALIQGKRWRGIHIHEMYEKGVLDGSMPYFTILGGFNGCKRRKWWQFWKKKYTFYNIPIPRVVVDFIKKEMFQGIDADTIENCYQEIIKNQLVDIKN